VHRSTTSKERQEKAAPRVLETKNQKAKGRWEAGTEIEKRWKGGGMQD
jgi:hypothetical protein